MKSRFWGLFAVGLVAFGSFLAAANPVSASSVVTRLSSLPSGAASDLPFPPNRWLTADLPFPPNRWLAPDLPFPPNRWLTADLPFPPNRW